MKTEQLRRIRALMVLHGIKGVDIARKLKVSPTTVYVVLTGKGKSRRIQQAVARALGTTIEDLWPENNHEAA